MSNIISRGAESILYLENDKLVKERIKKGYRLDEIDNKLRKLRTRNETKLLEKSKIINVPRVIEVKEAENKIIMDYLDGKLVKNVLDNLNEIEFRKICENIGEQIAKLHNNDIIHGDLTTSNMIVKDEKVFFIDFGLGFISKRLEGKAVDLHLLRQVLETKHFLNYPSNYELILEAYKKFIDNKDILERLEKVEARGRYKGKTK